MTHQELKRFQIDLAAMEMRCWSRGSQLLAFNDSAFGKRNGFERIEFLTGGEYFRVVCYDSGYDLHEEAGVNLTFEDICMNDEEWAVKLKELKQQYEIDREISKKKLSELNLKEKEREFERLKLELGK